MKITGNLFEGLINRLTSLPSETEWVEFKENRANEQELAEYISALGNSAAVAGEETAFMVWGVEDGTHRLVGTSFDPRTAKRETKGSRTGFKGCYTRTSTFGLRLVLLTGECS